MVASSESKAAMLTSLTLTNWKSFGETRNELPLAPLTLLVGPNGSGKSNALDALRRSDRRWR
jgi:chromosome segregation ATPase